MSLKSAIARYRRQGFLTDRGVDVFAVWALLDAGYTIKWAPELTIDGSAWCAVVELERR